MKKIICETIYCVYWRKGYCALNSISIDGLGRCGEAIVVDLSDELLEPIKEQMLTSWKEDEKK